MKAIRLDENNNVLIKSGDIEVWMELWIEDGEICADWNKYIFYKDNEEDMRVKKFQEKAENFEEASSLAFAYFKEHLKIELPDEVRRSFTMLIPIYEEAIKELPEERCERDAYLIDIGIDSGICAASMHQFDIFIGTYSKKIAFKYDLVVYWYQQPIQERREDSVKCLQWRVDVMKDLLESGEISEANLDIMLKTKLPLFFN